MAPRLLLSTMRWVVIVVVLWALSALSVLGLLMYFRTGSMMGAGVTKDGLMQIRPGITEQEVLASIGRPLWEHRFYGPGLGAQWVNDPSKSIWQYASPGFIGTGFAVYVTFKDGKVTATDIKNNDFSVYQCSEWKCPQIIGNGGLLDRLPQRPH